mmetsp:Transcript_51931/g.59272  ORF Transcript_51931/g.59272 Transcript_51931/m.59272 type:complete len:91 (-) Transcript_51931:314-586(-)
MKLLRQTHTQVLRTGIIGFELQKLGKFKDASDSYQRAVDLGASDASVYVNLGIIHKKMGNVDEALKNLNMALEIQPSNIAAIKSKSKSHL